MNRENIPQAIRSFIAVPLTEAVRAKICEFQETLKKRLSGSITWVKPDAMHLTLKFLGDIEPSSVASIRDTMQSVLAAEQPFIVHTEKFGIFPHSGPPRVLWVGLREERPCLVRIHEALEQGLEKLKIAKEDKEYSLHITLARVKGKINGNIEKMLQEYANISLGSCQVENVILFQSVLQPSGSVYTPLAEISLLAVKR
jgi:2'-5' RNA ligase